MMEQEVPGAKIAVISTIHILKPRGRTFSERQGLLFVGNLKHGPNADAVHFLMKEILPLIKHELPDIILTIVGDGVTPDIAAYQSDSVTVTGYVPNIEPYFDLARIFLAPIRFGAGVKGKIGEALSFGLPVVTSPVGAESMGLESGKNVMITDSPADFATSVINLYRDAYLWQRISDNGCQHIAANYTPEIIEPIINQSITNLGAPELRSVIDSTNK